MNTAFWQGRTVLVTGHTGFKGAWLSLWLHRLGARVIGYALEAPSRPSLFEEAGLEEVVSSVHGDVTDGRALAEVFAAHRPEVVIHMAAQSLVKISYEEPVRTYATNVLGTANVLEAVRRTEGVRAVVVVTTDKCYENREWVWGYRENDRLGGRDPYSNSKACAELVAQSYRDSFFPAERYDEHGVAVATVRAGNVIGGGDWARDRLIPDIVRAVSEGRPVAIRNPHAVRPWQFVMEPLRGYLVLAERLCEQGAAFAEAWNFAPDLRDTRPVSWIVERLTSAWGEGASWRPDPGPHPHEAGFLKLDWTKAFSRLGWEPRMRLAEAIDWIVEWHRAHRRGEPARATTEAQIERYQALLAAAD